MFFYFSKRSFSQFKVCRKNLTTPHHGLLNTKLRQTIICVIVIRIIVIRVIVIRIIVIVVVVFTIIIIINQLFTEVKVNIHHI